MVRAEVARIDNPSRIILNRENLLHSYQSRSYITFSEVTLPLTESRADTYPLPGPTLDYLEEAFTSEEWLIRFYYQVKKDFL